MIFNSNPSRGSRKMSIKNKVMPWKPGIFLPKWKQTKPIAIKKMSISRWLLVWFMRGNFFQMSQIQMFAYCPLLLGTKGLVIKRLLFKNHWTNVSFHVDSLTTNLKEFVTTQCGQRCQWIILHWQSVCIKISQTHKRYTRTYFSTQSLQVRTDLKQPFVHQMTHKTAKWG